MRQADGAEAQRLGQANRQRRRQRSPGMEGFAVAVDAVELFVEQLEHHRRVEGRAAVHTTEAMANDIEMNEVVITTPGGRGKSTIEDQILAIHNARAKPLFQNHFGSGARRTDRKFTFGNQHADTDITSHAVVSAGLGA